MTHLDGPIFSPLRIVVQYPFYRLFITRNNFVQKILFLESEDQEESSIVASAFVFGSEFMKDLPGFLPNTFAGDRK